ncbi:BRO-N domain-containing protein [Paracerasibacillus soli]|uniref:BRO family protein n=1 Tax=Paracerasibacillus soli TaxID=480284 RepID=A0ABU5CPB2_9BACI|nr:BRO family protein [Virgibacillus soli]MDY0407320.1 BRO family protein [Virgibacillus soli]
MMNNIKIFNFEGNSVRTSIKDGNVWWVAKDVCDVLGNKNNRDVIARLDTDERV